MKRKVITFMAVLTLSISLSACGKEDTFPLEDIPVEKEEEKKEETEEVEEEPTPEETEEDLVQKEIEKIQSALGEMPYYGDTANCKMTAEQATAYAQLIADGLAGDFSFRGGYDDEGFDIISWSEPFYEYEFEFYGEESINPVEVDRTQVILGDFSADGKPYLYIYSSQESSSFEVYGWNGNEPILSASGIIALRAGYTLSEQEDGTVRFVAQYFNTETCRGDEYLWAAVTNLEYAFIDGNLEQVSERALAKSDPLDNSDFFYIIENGEQTGICPEEDYETYLEEAPHQHTLPYTCFYDMTPCNLEEMVNYLNAYASVMSDGQSVPVEIKKVDIVKHDGTGITTKGEVPQEKVNSLEILRQYMNGEKYIGVADSIAFTYIDSYYNIGEPERFYFGITDLNNDNNQELLVSYKDDSDSNTYVFLPSSSKDALMYQAFQGVNKVDGTYLMYIGDSDIGVSVYLYVYDGTTFSEISVLDKSGALNSEGYKYTLTENGTTRDMSEEEFYSIWKDWESRHTDPGADTHLDIGNVENTFQVKIDVQSSGEWLVTNAE